MSFLFKNFIYFTFLINLYSTVYFTVARSAEGRLPGQPAALSWVLRVSVPGAFLRPAGGNCRVENLNSSIYVYLANLQLQQSHTLLTVSRGWLPELRLSYMVLISKV